MWWAVYFVAVTAILIAIVGVFSILADTYKGALEAYRIAKFAVDQWSSLSSQLNYTICLAAESLAKKALVSLNASVYKDLGPMFAEAMEEVRRRTLLKRLNYSWAFKDDVFMWNATFLKFRTSGAVDWLRPTELINSVEEIKAASFDLSASSIEDVLRPLVPKNAVLQGVVHGYLYGNGTYSGHLEGEYLLKDKTLLRCINATLSVSFTASHYATLTVNSTSPSVYIYYQVFIDN
ncbi:hypothetical protein [Pyrobaculum aerophilum]|uniref:hypothetical protein n=1 Tax=Pyrobaculum aerophilum TaxID=13773 RepID=UPI002FD9C6D2